MPAPAPPPKPGPLREMTRDHEEGPEHESATGSQVQSTNGETRNRTLSDESLRATTPEDQGLGPDRASDTGATSRTRANGTHSGSPQHFRRLTSSSAADMQFAPPRRAYTDDPTGMAESRRLAQGGTTPRKAYARQSSGHLRLNANGTKIRPGDTDLQEHEEKFCVFAQQLIDMLRRKPQREQTRTQHRLTFKEAISHFMKVNRIRESVAKILQASLCPTCKLLDLKPEKFLVQDRERHLKDMGLGRAGTNLSKPTGRFEVGSGSPSCRLGTLKAIWKKSVVCPFCRLIIHSLKEQENTEWVSTDAWMPENSTLLEKSTELEAECFASWQIDGREFVEPSSGNYDSSRARTRRICLHWEPEIFRKSFVVLVGSETLPPNFLGRRIANGPCSPKLMRDWLNACCEKHPRCETAPDKRFDLMISQAFFGVIDVWNMRLVRLPPGAPYIALSYPWGGVDQFKSLLQNVRELQAQRGIEKVWNSLPRTLKDTIKLVRDLGERYLWVDSLCIVQDSNKSWELNASVMDLVYGHALVTVCAADGDKPTTGLHGMDPRQRRFSQHMEDYAPGVRLMVSFLAESYIQNSAWNTRGWTFQERLLSKRCLIFTDSRVFFQCRSATMREDVTVDEPTGWSIEHAHAPWQILDDLDTRAVVLYMKSVEKYTSRDLSRPDNILSAFQGIGNTIGRSLSLNQSNLLFGLPRSHFDLALLWEPRFAPNERLVEGQDNTDSCVQGRVFPSWSWCGWRDAIMEYKSQSTLSGVTTNLHEWLMDHTWITWYFRDGHGSLKLVWNRNRGLADSEQPVSRWTGYRATSGVEGEELDAHGRRLANKWPIERRDQFEKTIPEYPFGVLVSEDCNEPEIQFPDQRFLQFWTWSAYLRVTEQPPAAGGTVAASSDSAPDIGNGRAMRRYGISDYKGDWCGTIVLDPQQYREMGAGAEQEFIAISEAKEFAREEYDSWMYYIPKEREQSEWDLFYVLLIEVRDEIAYRVGLGKVFKEAFENACGEKKQWKEIILG